MLHIDIVNNDFKDSYFKVEKFEIEKNRENKEKFKENEIEKSNIENDLKSKIKSNKKEHKYWVDALRILASFMVILVHSSSHAVSEVPILTSQWSGLVFWDSLCRSCVPLFIMISGMFFLDPKKDITISKLYNKYIFRIVKVVIFWNLFYGTINKYVFTLFTAKYDKMKMLNDFIFDLLFGEFHLWYLYMCVGLYMVTPLFRAITKSEDITIYFFVFGIVIIQAVPFLISIVENLFPGLSIYTEGVKSLIEKFMIYVANGYTTYYVLGYYLSKTEIKSKTLLYSIYGIGIFNLLGTYGLKLFFSFRNEKEINDYASYNSFNVLISGISIFLFFKYTVNEKLEKILYKPGVKTILLKLSDLSLGCYLIHIFYFDFFRCIGFNSYSFNTYIFAPIHALCIWILSNLTIYIIKKIPSLKQFV